MPQYFDSPNSPLEVSNLRGRRRRELEEQSVNGDPRASGLLRLLMGDEAEDPYTGTAERARVGKIRSSLDDAATYGRPEIAEQREDVRGFELEKAGEPAKVGGQYALLKQKLVGDTELERQRIESEGLARAARARMGSTGAGGRPPLSAGLLERVAGGSATRGKLAELMKIKPNVATGPIAGRAQSFLQKVPFLPSAGKDFTEFETGSADVLNTFVKAMTGAQMSEPEVARLSKQVPSVNDKDDIWATKAEFMDRAIRGLNVRIGLLNRGVPAEVLDLIPLEDLESNIDLIDTLQGEF